MGLKEIRLSKNLTQAQAATFLGISPRSYQQYENDEPNNAKYSLLCERLSSYETAYAVIHNKAYNTNVILGSDLEKLYETVSRFDKRDCYPQLLRYLRQPFNGKVFIIYGLRRTGKTTLIFQSLGDIDISKAAYIKLTTKDNMSMLLKDIETLKTKGYQYIFLDEVTLLNDFINTSSVLSDVYAMLGMKIILSGTDSLGFVFADGDELYDRNLMIHTSYISFKEYSRLLGIDSVDEYIEYGGTLKKENMGFDDLDSNDDEMAFADDESTRKYIDTAIARNIQHSLQNYRFGERFGQLKELYDNFELTNAINRIIDDMNHDFLIEVIESKFKSSDFGSARQLLLKEAPDPKAHILYDVNVDEITETLKSLIEIKEVDELNIKITQTHLKQIKSYLKALDLIENIPTKFDDGNEKERIIFTQPGMRFAITKALIYSITKDRYFSTFSVDDRYFIIDKIISDVKGRMLEDIVILDIFKRSIKSQSVFKYHSFENGEIDMVVYDEKSNSCELYEIKHSDKIAYESQAKYLINDKLGKEIEFRFGAIKNRYILYRGEDQTVQKVTYLNIEKFLKR